MYSVKTDNEIRYCTSCGAANKKSATICIECEKKINEKHRPVLDFIKKRIKNDISGRVKEEFFSLFTEFLKSHLYGVILTLTVAATGAVVLADPTPYIKTVNEFPAKAVEEAVTVPEEKTQELTEDQKWFVDMAYYNLSNYTLHRDAVVYAYEGATIPSDTLPLSQIYAENNVDGYNFKGAHELLTNSIPLGIYDNQGARFHKEGFEKGSYKFGEDVESDLGQELHKNGFDVMECIYYYAISKEETPQNETPANPVERERFRITFVSQGDEVYVAEDVFLDRIKGDTYDLYVKYGPNGYTI